MARLRKNSSILQSLSFERESSFSLTQVLTLYQNRFHILLCLAQMKTCCCAYPSDFSVNDCVQMNINYNNLPLTAPPFTYNEAICQICLLFILLFLHANSLYIQDCRLLQPSLVFTL